MLWADRRGLLEGAGLAIIPCMTMRRDETCKFLENVLRFDLALLVGYCDLQIDENPFDLNTPQLTAPIPIDQALRVLPDHDKKRIAEAVESWAYPIAVSDTISVETIPFWEIHEPRARLLAELIIHREMMIDVATRSKSINDVNDYYKAREIRIRQSLLPGLKYENPHIDLWDFYRYWKDNLPTYRDRREYIRNLFNPVIDALVQVSEPLVPPREPTGWERVDRARRKAREELEKASAEEQYQSIGFYCREILISLAQTVYDPAVHKSLDGVEPSKTDAKRILEAYIAHTLPGDSNDEVRKHARAALGLASHLVHRRTATKRIAALCLEATESTIAILRIIATTPE